MCLTGEGGEQSPGNIEPCHWHAANDNGLVQRRGIAHLMQCDHSGTGGRTSYAASNTESVISWDRTWLYHFLSFSGKPCNLKTCYRLCDGLQVIFVWRRPSNRLILITYLLSSYECIGLWSVINKQVMRQSWIEALRHIGNLLKQKWNCRTSPNVSANHLPCY